jgi:hypothetical protein
VGAVFVSYYPDLAVPGAVGATHAFAELALSRGARRLVLLSGRGEPEAERDEQAVRATGAHVTILARPGSFRTFPSNTCSRSAQRRDPPFGGRRATPFLDIDDLADIAVEALTDDRISVLNELTGPARSLNIAQAAAEIGQAVGRDIRYTPVSLDQHAIKLAEHGVSSEFVDHLTHLFEGVVDGRNADTTDAVRRTLGREPRDFADYARQRHLERVAGERLRTRDDGRRLLRLIVAHGRHAVRRGGQRDRARRGRRDRHAADQRPAGSRSTVAEGQASAHLGPAGGPAPDVAGPVEGRGTQLASPVAVQDRYQRRPGRCLEA